MKFNYSLFSLFIILSACSAPQTFDILLSNGTIIDGTGTPEKAGSIGIVE